MSVLSLTLVFLCIFNVSCQDLIMLVGDVLPSIHHVSLKNSRRSSFIIRNISLPVAIDYDAGSSVMYWTDVKLHQIWSLNLNTSETKIILTLNERSILGGLAVDTSRSKIFYTDEGNNVISSIGTDGTGRDVILNTGLDQPRAIVLHEERRKVYWTDWGFDSYIASANYEDSGFKKIVTSGLGWLNGLTLDKENDVLYWCDAFTKKIEAVNVDGTGRRLVIWEPLSYYFDIFYVNEVLFFTDWTKSIKAPFDCRVGCWGGLVAPETSRAMPAENLYGRVTEAGQIDTQAIRYIPARGGTVGSLATGTFLKLMGIHVFSTADFSNCPFGRYGAKCMECGHCKEDSVCDKTTGICLAGCTAGYTNQQCKQNVDPNEGSTKIATGNNDNDDNSLNPNHVILIGAVAGGVVVLLVIVVVIIVILLRKKRQVPKPSKDHFFTTLERNRPPNPYSEASDLPPSYTTIGDLDGPRADNSRLPGSVNSQYCYIQDPASCEGDTGYLSVVDESNGKLFSAMA